MLLGLMVINVSMIGVGIVSIAASAVGNPLQQLVLEEVELVAALVEGYLPLRGHLIDSGRTLAEQLAGFCHTDGRVHGCAGRAAGDG